MVNRNALFADQGNSTDWMATRRGRIPDPLPQSQAGEYAAADIIRLSLFFKQNVNPILVFDAGTTLVKTNPAADRLFRRLPLPAAEILPADHPQIIQSCLRGRFKEYAVEVTVQSHILALTYHPLPSFGLVYVYVIDLTDYRHAEAELVRVATHTLALAKTAILTLQQFRRSRTARCHPPVTSPDLFVAMDGSVFVGEWEG